MSIFHPTISFIGKNKEQNCAHVNFWCNSSLLQPCCDANNRCIQYSIGISECVIEEPQEFKSELINSSCTFDRDCRRLLHAECSEDEQCVCKPKNAYRNNKCLPILGEFCTHNHQSCATAYSECINFKCQCKNGYSQRSDNQCMLNIIGENCDDDEFCSQEISEDYYQKLILFYSNQHEYPVDVAGVLTTIAFDPALVSRQSESI
ncbi:Protein of unknown function [Cotesia congregata]|uniref:Uncharacterized protein n=1 Tax=Cotesia congregata TaxID=51543 RepID=A0A8J2HC89_COTCN|nr:Protein of unknown function [Cotesia congregata]